MSDRIINISDVESNTVTHGKSYAWSRKKITAKLNSEKLGASVYEIPPGKRAFVYHFHYANEELFYVLAGKGAVRTPEGEKPITTGDFVAAVSGKDGAHQIINNSDAPLRYLVESTMIEPEVVEYPDSEKVFAMTDEAPGGEKKQRNVSLVFKKANATSYWEGEPE